MHFSESFGVELQGVHSALPRQVQHHPSGHHVSTAEHRRTVHLRRVEDDVKLSQLVENHVCRLRESSENKSIPSFLVALQDFKFAEVDLQLSVVDLCKAQTVEHFRLQPYFEAEKVGGTLDLLCKASGDG